MQFTTYDKSVFAFLLAGGSLYWFTWLLPGAIYWLCGIDNASPNFPYIVSGVPKSDGLPVALIKSATWVGMQCTFAAIGSVQLDDYPRSRSFVLMVVPVLAMTGVWLEFYSYANDYVVTQNVCVAISGFGTWLWARLMFRGVNRGSIS